MTTVFVEQPLICLKFAQKIAQTHMPSLPIFATLQATDKEGTDLDIH